MLMRGVIAAASIAALCGCAAPLPTYPATIGDDVALAIIADRLESVQRTRATATLTLTSSSGDSVRLDAAMVVRSPGVARLRAWKFGTSVLDLAISPAGTWLYVAERDGAGPADAGSLDTSVSGVGPVLDMLSGRFFRGATPLPDGSSAATLVASGPGWNEVGVRCEIDRRTLTPRKFIFPRGHEMSMGRYMLVNGVAWPGEISFTGDSGSVRLLLDDVELNPELPDTVFEPSPRARRLP
jgi:hypothetical protein